MRITSYQCRLISRASSAVLPTSYGAASETRPHVIVGLQAEDAKWGLGESSPLPNFTGETAEQVRFMLEQEYLPMMVGLELFNQRQVDQALGRLPANRSARCAVDVALHDLRAQVLGLPLYRLLGGSLSDRVDVTRPIGIQDDAATARQAAEYAAQGFRTIKLKVGTDRERDLARVCAVREALGSGTKIRIDANQGYSAADAAWLVRKLEDQEIQYIEQPVPEWDLAGLRRVREASTVPVAADESVHTVHDLVRVGEAHAADFVIIKLVKAGGLAPALALAAIAAAYAIRCTVVSTFDTQIGAAACLHLALAIGHPGHAHELTVFSSQPGMADTRIRVERGAVIVTEEPGLGVRSIPEMQPAPAGPD